MVLLPKEFTIDIEKIDKRFKSITSSNYDGVVKDGSNFKIMWKSEPTNQDLAAIEIYWRDLTQLAYSTPTAEEQSQFLASILSDARKFGDALIVQFAMENVGMGITAARKTRAVADYCYKIQYYLSTGSLYAALEELEDTMDDEIPEELSPFVTQSRLQTYVTKLKTYLQIP